MSKLIIFLCFSFLVFSTSAIAQNTKTKTLDQIITCHALSYVTVAVFVPNEVMEKISAFDSDTKKYLKSDHLNLKRVSEGFELRGKFFSDLYKLVLNDQSLTHGQYLNVLDKQLTHFKNTILKDEGFAAELAESYPKCQAYVEAVTPLILKTKEKGISIEIIKIISDISKKSFAPNDQEIGIMYIAGNHWKHMNFASWKTLREAVKNKTSN